MLASELMSIIREDLLDDVSDADAGYESDARWSDAFLLRQINEAQRQACYRGDLRHLYDAETDELCSLPLTFGVRSYVLDPRILRLEEVRLGSRVLAHTSRARLDETGINWRSMTSAAPSMFFLHGRTLILDAPPTGGALALSIWREPIDSVTEEDELEWLDEPEKLGHWVAHKAFMIPDEDLHDAKRAAMHLELFNLTFGVPTSARERLEILSAPADLRLHPATPYAQPIARRLPFDIET
jgi:hypothetical protein